MRRTITDEESLADLKLVRHHEMLFVLEFGQTLEAIAFIDSASSGILAMDLQSEQIHVLAARLFFPNLFGKKLRFPDEMFQNLIGIPPFRIGGISTKLLVEAKLRDVEQPGAFFSIRWRPRRIA